jgi:hypothetical protein
MRFYSIHKRTRFEHPGGGSMRFLPNVWGEGMLEYLDGVFTFIPIREFPCDLLFAFTFLIKNLDFIKKKISLMIAFRIYHSIFR